MSQVVTSCFVGVDLGQAHDPSAIAVLDRTISFGFADPERSWNSEPAEISCSYDVRHLERPKLGTPYLRVCERVAELAGALLVRGPVELVVDATGVGRPVLEMLHPLVWALQVSEPGGVWRRCPMLEVTITGGDRETTRGAGRWHVPKRDLVGGVAAELGSQRLRIASALPDAAVLVDELRKFRMKISTAGNDTYSAWRENDHDDLVLAVALALWRARRRPVAINGTRRIV